MEHRADVAPDDDMNEVQVQLGTSPRQLQESDFDDPFMAKAEELLKIEGLNANFKRNASRKLSKAYEGVDGAKSKKLDPMDVSGYSLFQIIQPPFNVTYLAQLYELSPYHHAAVDAKVANVVGLGYKFIENQKTLDKLEDVSEDEAKLEKVRRKISRAKVILRDKLESFNSDDTFEEVMKKVYRDLEVTGNGYLEIGRTSSGQIGYLGHIPSITMRVRRQRDGFVQVVYNKYTFFRNFGDSSTKDQVGTDPRPNEVIHFKKYSPVNTYYGIPDVMSAAKAVAGDEFAARYNLDYFENKAVPRYIIVSKGARLNADSERKLLEFFQIGLKGRNHRTLYIPLPSDGENARVDFEMKPVESGIQDSSFQNYSIENRDRILIAHRTPLSKIGYGTPSPLDDKIYKEQVSRPAQDMLEMQINKVIKEFSDMFNFQFEELTLTDELSQAQIDQIYLTTQVITPNEVRMRKGLNPIDSGEEVFDPQAKAAEIQAQTMQSRERDKTRNAAPVEAVSGRARKGEGRKVK